jgi:hypothetical protein
LAMRKLQPTRHRPFKLSASIFFCHLAFYACNLMLYWCGFDILWKLDLALLMGFVINLIYQKRSLADCSPSLYWFVLYMASMLLLSYLGSFGGIHRLQFPLDIIIILPFSITILHLSQWVLIDSKINEELTSKMVLAEAIDS